MKNKGFTMVELLAVIIVLGMLAAILYPTIRKAINKNKQSLYNEQLDEIVNAAKLYGSDNLEKLPETIGEEKSIDVNDLISNDYIEKMKNPKTNDYLDIVCSASDLECVSVKVKKVSSRKWTYEISDTTK